MKGLDSAAMSVAYGHFVIPSWRDLATGSRFIADLKNWTKPDDLPYHLIFSYRDGESGESGESGDGVIPLRSQLPLWLQRDATMIRGFEGGHIDLLSDPVFVQVLLDTLLTD